MFFHNSRYDRSVQQGHAKNHYELYIWKEYNWRIFKSQSEISVAVSNRHFLPHTKPNCEQLVVTAIGNYFKILRAVSGVEWHREVYVPCVIFSSNETGWTVYRHEVNRQLLSLTINKMNEFKFKQVNKRLRLVARERRNTAKKVRRKMRDVNV